MIKLVYRITRRPGMSVDEFSRYWHNVHGPIGRRIPGLRRLVQSHPVPHPEEMWPPTFDGMAELWFDDLAALPGSPAFSEWQASNEDEANFIDHARTALFLTEEREIPAYSPFPNVRLQPGHLECPPGVRYASVELGGNKP